MLDRVEVPYAAFSAVPRDRLSLRYVTIPRPLVECIFGTLVLLEYSSDDDIEPHVAVRGMEDIVSSLASLTLDEQREFILACAEVAKGYQGAAATEIPASIADSLGLERP